MRIQGRQSRTWDAGKQCGSVVEHSPQMGDAQVQFSVPEKINRSWELGVLTLLSAKDAIWRHESNIPPIKSICLNLQNENNHTCVCHKVPWNRKCWPSSYHPGNGNLELRVHVVCYEQVLFWSRKNSFQYFRFNYFNVCRVRYAYHPSLI